jgi:hypothetical protein
MQADMPRNVGSDWDFWREGLDRAFFMKVYQRSAIIGVIASLIFLGFDQKQAALGLFSGLVVGLFSLWKVEVTTKLLFNGGKHAGLKLAIGAFIKLPFSLVGLTAVAWAAFNGYMNIFAVVGGVLLVHATMLVMTVATAMANQDSNRERYR